MSNIDATLAERGSRYGEFTGHAEITQAIKDAMVNSIRWEILDDDMREALEMVAHKIGRILNGDPNYIDSWTDIIGYTRLVEKRLITEQATVKSMKVNDPLGADVKCNTPGCPECYPENRISVSEAMTERDRFNKVDAIVRAFVDSMTARPKPTVADVEAALKTLLDSGAITPVTT